MRSYRASVEPTSTHTEPLRQPQPHGLFRALAPDAGRIHVVNPYANAANRPVRRTGFDLAEVALLGDQMKRFHQFRQVITIHLQRALKPTRPTCRRSRRAAAREIIPQVYRAVSFGGWLVLEP